MTLEQSKPRVAAGAVAAPLADERDAAIKVLLIEDNRGDALLLREMLADIPAARIEWVHELRLSDAAQRLLAGEKFDVVLLDLSLPDSTGLETFDKIHRLAPKTPAVMLTGLDDETLAVQAVQQGAEDYLVKGQVDGQGLLRSMRYAIERARRYDAECALRATQDEMRMVRAIQRRLFPLEPPAVPGFDVAGASYSAVAAGGDYFDFFHIAEECVALVIADVSGHGLGPALLMACPDLAAAMERVNRAVTGDTLAEHFVTLIAVCLDPGTGALKYSNAGHPPGLVFRADGSIKRTLDSLSMPLGVDAETPFESAAGGVLEPGELAVLLTDGVMEARRADGEFFGTERAIETIRAHQSASSHEIINALYDTVRAFRGSEQQFDDITAVVVKSL
jgi:phosphoserine phosphatase RsbU/P